MYNVDFRNLEICFYEVDCKIIFETDFHYSIKFDSKNDAKQDYNKLVNCKDFRVNNDCDLFCTTLIVNGDATVSYDSTHECLCIKVLVMN